jgi:polysaccharide export outer membrane protein
MSVRILLLGLLLGLTACASGGGADRVAAGSMEVEYAKAGNLPPPARQDATMDVRSYTVGPFDKLVIDVFGIEDLSRREVQTDAGARFSFPLAGIVDAGGLTPQEIERLLEDRLRGRYVRNPQVTVNLKETGSQLVTVDGQVREPGLYPVVGRMTLMRAIATAKGLADFAKLDDVVVFRTVEGRKMAGLYNLKLIRRGVYEDPEIYANDVVVVGDSNARRLFKDVLQAAPLITTPLILFLQRQ